MASHALTDDGRADFHPHQCMVRANSRAEVLFRIREGWAYRFHYFDNGRRQITALYLPGDYCGLQCDAGSGSTQAVIAITSVRADRIAITPLAGGTRSPLWQGVVQTIERQADWLNLLGKRSAKERIAHLFCEIYSRLKAHGQVYARQCAVPLTQSEIADITCLTPVHVNRTLQEMRAAGLLDLQSRWLRVPDIRLLQQVAAGATRID